MFKALITEFPLSDVPKERTVTEEKIRKYTYTKEEVDVLISNAVREAVAEAKKIDEESMAKHNRDATVISMILGFTTLALFVDGLLRMLGIIPPFMDLDYMVYQLKYDSVHKKFPGTISTKKEGDDEFLVVNDFPCLLYTSPSPRDRTRSRMPSSA